MRHASGNTQFFHVSYLLTQCYTRLSSKHMNELVCHLSNLGAFSSELIFDSNQIASEGYWVCRLWILATRESVGNYRCHNTDMICLWSRTQVVNTPYLQNGILCDLVEWMQLASSWNPKNCQTTCMCWAEFLIPVTKALRRQKHTCTESWHAKVIKLTLLGITKQIKNTTLHWTANQMYAATQKIDCYYQVDSVTPTMTAAYKSWELTWNIRQF